MPQRFMAAPLLKVGMKQRLAIMIRLPTDGRFKGSKQVRLGASGIIWKRLEWHIYRKMRKVAIGTWKQRNILPNSKIYPVDWSCAVAGI